MKLKLVNIGGIVLAASLNVVSVSPVSAMNVCSSSAVDPDGDGWGWENNQSCQFIGGAASSSSASSGSGFCQSAGSDPDGDGWGWENGTSCRVGGSSSSSSSSGGGSSSTSTSSGGNPVCASSASDPDGDGWGFENGSSCRVGASTSSGSGSSGSSSAPSASTSPGTVNGVPVCTTTASDFDGDGWGHEGGASCRVTSATANADASTSNVAPPPVGAASAGTSGGRPICLTDSSDVGNTGFGYENNQTCAVVAGVTATPDNPLLNTRVCEPWFEIQYGNYRLQNNTWASDAVYSDNWHQCIEVTGNRGNYIAKWDYNWLGRSEGDEFSVKSYPQVYYGRKTRFNISGSVAETGMPVRINGMPQFTVNYRYSETGNAERNVALESFFHTSCEAEEHNKFFELMVWVDKPVVRIPGPQVASARISGQDWSVHTNPSLGWGYVAFVADNPQNQGTLDWNAFVEWVRFQGPSAGVPSIGNNTCMGAIEIGTETFWGNGTFTLHQFDVIH